MNHRLSVNIIGAFMELISSRNGLEVTLMSHSTPGKQDFDQLISSREFSISQ
jgi:hypothetical protein